MGYPLVTMEILNSTTMKISQQRYFKGSNGLELKKYSSPSYGYKWDVPLFYQSGETNFGMRWLTREKPLHLKIEKEETPVVVNVDRHGFFRQNYDARGWKNIIKQLKEDHKIYSAKTRFGLISDAFAVAQIDRLNYETVFQLLEYLPNEKVVHLNFYRAKSITKCPRHMRPKGVRIQLYIYLCKSMLSEFTCSHCFPYPLFCMFRSIR
ncbi:hypothetical protein Aduo_016516 [Ancylostoma duodenale]